MRPGAELDFILARIWEWIREHPPTGPLLGAPEPRAARETCKLGHAAMVTRPNGARLCGECARLRKRAARATR